MGFVRQLLKNRYSNSKKRHFLISIQVGLVISTTPVEIQNAPHIVTDVCLLPQSVALWHDCCILGCIHIWLNI